MLNFCYVTAVKKAVIVLFRNSNIQTSLLECLHVHSYCIEDQKCFETADLIQKSYFVQSPCFKKSFFEIAGVSYNAFCHPGQTSKIQNVVSQPGDHKDFTLVWRIITCCVAMLRLRVSVGVWHQGCSGVGSRGNGVPTPFSNFALKWVWSCFNG